MTCHHRIFFENRRRFNAAKRVQSTHAQEKGLMFASGEPAAYKMHCIIEILMNETPPPRPPAFGLNIIQNIFIEK